MFINLEDFCIPVENNKEERLKAFLNMFRDKSVSIYLSFT